MTDVARSVEVRTISRQSDLTLSEVTKVYTDPLGTPDRFTRRFWARVDKRGPVNPRRPLLGPCWMWTGSKYSFKGQPTYGQVMYGGVRMSAHRASYLMHAGPVPEGHDVMHLCDVKACVNPSHLATGTRTDNLLDHYAGNPGIRAGERAGRSRLTWIQVHAIRDAWTAGETQASLAKRYGVVPVQIHNIVKGKRWLEEHCPIHKAEAVA